MSTAVQQLRIAIYRVIKSDRWRILVVLDTSAQCGFWVEFYSNSLQGWPNSDRRSRLQYFTGERWHIRQCPLPDEPFDQRFISWLRDRLTELHETAQLDAVLADVRQAVVVLNTLECEVAFVD